MRPLQLALVLLAVVTVCALLAGDASQAAPTSYPLVCTGGGNMRFSVWGSGSPVLIYFDRATTGGTSRTPGPGQCAWLDRPILSAEPNNLRFDTRMKALSVQATGQRVTFINLEPAGARDVLRAVLAGSRFYVHAYNDGATRNLRVTRFGP